MAAMKWKRETKAVGKAKQAQIRKKLLRYSMAQIRNLVKSPNDEEYGNLDEYDTDMDFGDNESVKDLDLLDGENLFNEITDLGTQSKTSPFLDFENNYIISVNKVSETQLICSFEPPHWMTNRVSSEYKEVLNSMMKIVIDISRYFQKTQQAFLSDPYADTFQFAGELTQKNFVKVICTSGAQFDEVDLSLIKDKIWFVWDDKSAPLTVIFSKGNSRSN